MRFLLLVFLTTSVSALGLCNDGYESDSTFVKEISITPNYINKDGAAFSIYCVKYKKDWLLLSINNYDVSLYIVDKKGNENKEGSTFLKKGVEKVLLKGLHKKVNKEKEITDIAVNDYYKLTGKGKKVIKHLLLIDQKEEKKKKKFLFF